MDTSISCQNELGVFSHAFHMERSPLTIARSFEFEQLLSFFRERKGEHWFHGWNAPSSEITMYIKDRLSSHLNAKVEEAKRDRSRQPQIATENSSRQVATPQDEQTDNPAVVGPLSAAADNVERYECPSTLQSQVSISINHGDTKVHNLDGGNMQQCRHGSNHMPSGSNLDGTMNPQIDLSADAARHQEQGNDKQHVNVNVEMFAPRSFQQPDAEPVSSLTFGW